MKIWNCVYQTQIALLIGKNRPTGNIRAKYPTFFNMKMVSVPINSYNWCNNLSIQQQITTINVVQRSNTVLYINIYYTASNIVIYLTMYNWSIYNVYLFYLLQKLLTSVLRIKTFCLGQWSSGSSSSVNFFFFFYLLVSTT